MNASHPHAHREQTNCSIELLGLSFNSILLAIRSLCAYCARTWSRIEWIDMRKLVVLYANGIKDCELMTRTKSHTKASTSTTEFVFFLLLFSATQRSRQHTLAWPIVWKCNGQTHMTQPQATTQSPTMNWIIMRTRSRVAYPYRDENVFTLERFCVWLCGFVSNR